MVINNLSKRFPLGGGVLGAPKTWLKAVQGVSFTVRKGESFGIVGESGCGKTTLGRMIVRLLKPTGGHILFRDTDITRLNRKQLRPYRQKLQIIFQDPYSSLDPRMTIADIITEPLFAQGKPDKHTRRQIAEELLEKVGLRSGGLNKYPHEFSGGQRQRIGIARALCVRPELIVADEPVSALDVSIQAQVINLLDDLKDDFNLSYVFISHDISVVEHVCDRIAVMYLGSLVEIAPIQQFISNHRHPYSKALLAAIPIPDPQRRIPPAAMEGDVPNPIDPPPGCPFHPRCAYAFAPCLSQKPELETVHHSQNGNPPSNHTVACWLNKGQGLMISEDGGRR